MAQRSSLLWIAILALLGLVPRIWIGLELGDDLRVTEPIIDGKLYLQQAAAWATGIETDEPYFTSPLYPRMLALALAAGAQGMKQVHALQAVLGLLGTLLLALAVRRDFGTASMVATGILTALCGPLLAIETQVLGASLLFFLVAAGLWLWPTAHARAWRWGTFGVVLGLLTVGRGSFVLVLVGFVVMTLHRIWRNRSASTGGGTRRALLVGASLLLIGFLVPILPVAVHQTRTTGSLQWTTLNSGLNLYVGNNAFARGIYSTPPDLDIQADFTGRASASRNIGRRLDWVEADHYWRERALEFLRENPARAAWLWGRKFLLYLSPHEIPQIENFRLLAHDSWSLRFAAVRFGWILPLTCLGLWRGRRETRPSPASRGLTPYLVVVMVGWITTLLFFATARYRIPFLPGFLALAGIGAAGLWDHVRQRRLDRPRVIALIVILSIAGLQWSFPSYPRDKADAFAFYQLGLRYQERDEHPAAIREFERALTHYPSMGDAWNGIAESRADQGDLAGAIDGYRRAAEGMVDPTWALYNLGITYGRSGNDEAAAQALMQARNLQPSDPRIRERLAIALGRIGQIGAAMSEIDEALRLDPEHVASLRTKGLLEEALSRSGSAGP